jgi:hypothetical protein
MVGYLVLGVCLLAALLLAGRWLLNADPRVLAKVVRYGAVGVLGLIAAFFILTGRFAFGVLPAMLAFAVWRAMRGGGGMRFPFGGGLGGLGGFGKPSAGRSSDVETEYLRMTLEHDTGEMHGEVLKGPFDGRRLADLSLPQLLELLGDCRREDPQSAQLLETYLDRTEGPDWREADEEPTGGRDEAPSGGGAMTVDEAREILGVDAGAGEEEIRAAHHRLMLKNHPDKGGSSYLAAKINQAKDVLLRT